LQSRFGWLADGSTQVRLAKKHAALGFQPAMAAFVPPSDSTPAGTPALPARGPLHGRRSSQNRGEPKRNASLVVQWSRR
jgi:hypothetical protein